MRYFLDSDDSGHWYLIPADLLLEWRDFLTTEGTDDYAEPPAGVKPLNGHPNGVSFTDPQEDM